MAFLMFSSEFCSNVFGWRSLPSCLLQGSLHFLIIVLLNTWPHEIIYFQHNCRSHLKPSPPKHTRLELSGYYCFYFFFPSPCLFSSIFFTSSEGEVPTTAAFLSLLVLVTCAGSARWGSSRERWPRTLPALCLRRVEGSGARHGDGPLGILAENKDRGRAKDWLVSWQPCLSGNAKSRLTIGGRTEKFIPRSCNWKTSRYIQTNRKYARV